MYREARRMELAAAGKDLKKLREIARIHIEKAAMGDMHAIRELRDTLDGKPAQALEHTENTEGQRPRKIIHEYVHVQRTPEELARTEELTRKMDWKDVTSANGNGKDDAN
jgi:hypothetical protein